MIGKRLKEEWERLFLIFHAIIITQVSYKCKLIVVNP